MAKILLVGGGGREHALAWKLVASPRCDALVVAPGNPGIAALPKVTVAAVKAEDTDGMVALARAEAVDLVVCGPEGPLADGLGDAMRAAGLAFFGPSRAAAEIEGSKAFAKRLMAEAGVPGFHAEFALVLLAPRGVPDAIVEKFALALIDALKNRG